MIRKFHVIGLLLFSGCIYSSCITDELLKPIPPSELLHDNNSKVWIIQEDLEGDKDYAPIKRKDKQTLLFFESGDFYLQKLNDWGSDDFLQGIYTLYTDDKTKEITLRLSFENQPAQLFLVSEYDPSAFQLVFKDEPKRKLLLVPITRPSSP